MFSLLWSVTARAFDDDVEHHPDIVDLCKKWFRKEDLTDPCFKLALIPKQVRMRSFLIYSRKRVSSHWLCLNIYKVWLPLSQAKLNFGTDKATGRPTQYPLISVENVFVFPGERHFVILIFCTCDKKDIILICGLKLNISSPLFFLAQGLQYFYAESWHSSKCVPGIPELLRKAFNNLGAQLFGAGKQVLFQNLMFRNLMIQFLLLLLWLIKSIGGDWCCVPETRRDFNHQ